MVLALNLVHHLVAQSREAARALVRAALGISSAVLADMGSFTEHGPWPWRQQFDRYWSHDEQMWADLFGAAASRRALLRYPAMTGGTRVLWHLQGERSALT